jgi:hypothetical protein
MAFALSDHSDIDEWQMPTMVIGGTNQVKMRHITSSGFLFSDFKAGLYCACAGSALFSILFNILAGIRWSEKFDSNMLEFSIAIFFYCCFFSSLPAGIGVCVLGVLLRNQKRNGTLTQSRAIKTGILLAGIAITIICGVGLLYALFSPHNNWYSIWDDLQQGKLIATFPGYLYDYVDFAFLHWNDILLATTIACIAGGWTGKILAKQLLRADD